MKHGKNICISVNHKGAEEVIVIPNNSYNGHLTKLPIGKFKFIS